MVSGISNATHTQPVAQPTSAPAQKPAQSKPQSAPGGDSVQLSSAARPCWPRCRNPGRLPRKLQGSQPGRSSGSAAARQPGRGKTVRQVTPSSRTPAWAARRASRPSRPPARRENGRRGGRRQRGLRPGARGANGSGGYNGSYHWRGTNGRETPPSGGRGGRGWRGCRGQPSGRGSVHDEHGYRRRRLHRQPGDGAGCRRLGTGAGYVNTARPPPRCRKSSRRWTSSACACPSSAIFTTTATSFSRSTRIAPAPWPSTASIPATRTSAARPATTSGP